MIVLALLLALALYVLLARVVVRMIGLLSRICAFTTAATKALQTVCVAFFVLLPTWDIIPGRVYFNHLCKEAGVKVFKTVKVDKSYFLPNGEPNQDKLKELFLNPAILQQPFSPQFHIRKSTSLIQEKTTGEILGTATGFSYLGGWLNVYLLPEGPPSKCPDYLVHGRLWNRVIKPDSLTSDGGN
jgi:hypothetical protein